MSTLSLRRPYLVLYMSPKMPAKVFRRFFIVSSLSSPWVCDWLPCRWNGTLDVGGSSERRLTDGALLTVLDWEAVGIEETDYDRTNLFELCCAINMDGQRIWTPVLQFSR